MSSGFMPAQLPEVPFWLEDVLFVLFAATVCLIVHLSRSPPPPKKKKIAEVPHKTVNVSSEAADALRAWSQKACKEDTPAWVSKVPKSSEEIPGVTDTRFEGVILSYKTEEGYGFIKCREIYRRFSRDVFLHRAQVGNFKVGDRVSFNVFLNRDGFPQAKELIQPKEAEKAVQFDRYLRCLGTSFQDGSGEPEDETKECPSSAVGCQKAFALNPYAKEFTMPGMARQAVGYQQETPVKLNAKDIHSGEEAGPQQQRPLEDQSQASGEKDLSSLKEREIHLKKDGQPCERRWGGVKKVQEQQLQQQQQQQQQPWDQRWVPVKKVDEQQQQQQQQRPWDQSWAPGKKDVCSWKEEEVYYKQQRQPWDQKWSSGTKEEETEEVYYKQQRQPWDQSWASGTKVWRPAAPWSWWKRPEAGGWKKEEDWPPGEQYYSKQWPARSQAVLRKWVPKE